MTVIYIILAAIAYIAIGGFLGGLFQDDDVIYVWIVFWPVMLLFVSVVYVAYWPSKLGDTIISAIKRNKRRKK